MRVPRVFVAQPLQSGREVLLPEQAGEHIARVLRLDRGHPLILFNGDGREYVATLASLAKRAVTADVTAIRPIERESPLALTLAQGIARGEKMDWILQKATELGAARIIPVTTERAEPALRLPHSERTKATTSPPERSASPSPISSTRVARKSPATCTSCATVAFAKPRSSVR